MNLMPASLSASRGGGQNGAMGQDELDAALNRLYGVAPEGFVAERTRLAQELKAGGKRPEADEVAKLRKPTAAAWALNLVAREEPDAVQEWLGTAAGLRDASTRAAEVGGDAVRAAMVAHRAATARLTETVRDRAQPGGRPLSPSMLDRVQALLQSATADADRGERLRAGRVAEEATPATPLPAPPAKRERAVAKPRRRRPEPDTDARAERVADLERRVAAAEEEVRRRREEASGRAAEAQAAAERLENARRTLRRSESEAAAVLGAGKEAGAAAAAAERELRELRKLLSRAGR
jgi:hypothetical protein